jgi:hypothetical protein
MTTQRFLIVREELFLVISVLSSLVVFLFGKQLMAGLW